MDLTINAPSALVVDDEEPVGRMVARMLESKGYKTQVVHDPVKALDRVRDRAFDLVVSDLRMPGKNGVELLSQVIELRPDTTTIMLTGFADDGVEARARAVGVDAFLSKMSEPNEIESSIAEAVMHKTLRVALTKLGQ